jgi:ketopantoate reductase
MCQAADETALVAQAQNITLPYESASNRVLEVAQATAENRSSMAQDIARGMPSEIDSISGAIVRIGQQYGVDTPVNQALLILIKSQITSGEWQSKIEKIPGPWQLKIKAILSITSEK